MTNHVRRLVGTASTKKEAVLGDASMKECAVVQMTGNAALLHLKVGFYSVVAKIA